MQSILSIDNIMSAQAALEHTLQALKSPIGKRKRTRVCFKFIFNIK